jgi:hypothetical protein
MKKYKVIIIGAGPAGIFSALTLANSGVDSILLLEKGKDITKRSRYNSEMLCGWGGAGAFSDGKLTLSSEVGGFLNELLNPQELSSLLKATDAIYVKYGAPEKIYGKNSKELKELSYKARKAELELVPSYIRHIGTENCKIILEKLQKDLSSLIEIRTETAAEQIIVDENKVVGVELENGESYEADFVIAAPGRSGSKWMKKEAVRLNLRTKASPVDIGVRVEIPAHIFKHITDIAYESKLVYHSETVDDKVRTFCMNPYGEVVEEQIDGVKTVNGHSYANKKSANTNFALLVSSTFTDPFDDPIAYGLYVARLANLLGKGVIVQRLSDLLDGRRSTNSRISKCLTKPSLISATPGDLSFVFPYRHLLSIIEMLKALDKLAPGVFSRHTLLYGVEIKLYSNRIKVYSNLETDVHNLFAIGDGAGITRGLIQASASGIWAAKMITERIDQNSIVLD